MICAGCGTENPAGQKYCGECGATLTGACPACGTANPPGFKFCGECGAALAAGAPTPAPIPAPEAERRLVSVLFADLVGFTTLSENRDPEEVRELLSRYFDTARQVIGRYGGTVEKFIGDAVMAVWGAPIAQEDDAERTVRAALDLVSAVAALGREAGAPDLRLRAGVVTGEAAVTIGAVGQGMVAGDLVNTASRVQSIATPGSVLVGEATRRASEVAIDYEDAGKHELKGKEESVLLWRAVRVVAGRGGEGRSTGLEAPFVGRDRELHLVKELFHSTADEGRARLVSVVGVAGIGKSRLGWEFYKYVDGLVETILWHKGRCLAYGEGVAYWALAEMVRMRAGIIEEEAPETALPKLRETIEQYVADGGERTWLEPRLQHLLGLAERTAPDREDLFSAWRLFFERLAEAYPTVLLFEDLHWADPSLLDFVEYLLEWSRNYPIYVLTLARPDLLERRPTWGATTRSFHSLFLEPLAEEAREELLQGLAPGLPAALRAQIRERAEGVPLYAVETVRMLLDRGLLEKVGREYRLKGPVDALEVPETLHALLAARLDGLEPRERRLLEDASVLGKTFSKRALSAVSGLDAAKIEPLLATLLRKEILTLEDDPRSPERGQYGFLHGLVQRVAYETLSRRERKARHLGVARYLESEWGADEAEIVEVLAAHYLEAYRAVPDAEDAAELKATARNRLARAGERAASLAASEEGQGYFERAAELADDEDRAELLERAGEMAYAGARFEEAQALFEEAIALFEAQGARHPAARVWARCGSVMYFRGRLDEAIPRLEESFGVLSGDEPDEDLAMLAAELGRVLFFAGQDKLAAERIEFALETAEALRLPGVIAQALNTKHLILYERRSESLVLLEGALKIALENDLPPAALRAYYNLTEALLEQDRIAEAVTCARSGLALARRRGERYWEASMLSQLGEPLFLVGDWDAALESALEMVVEGERMGFDLRDKALLRPLTRIHANRGEVEEARRVLAPHAGRETSTDLDERAMYAVARSIVNRAEGRLAEALSAGEEAVAEGRALPTGGRLVTEGLVETTEAAFDLGDLAKAKDVLDEFATLPANDRTQYTRAQESRLRARLAALRAEGEQAQTGFRAATASFRELGVPFWLSVTLLEHAEWLVDEGKSVEAEPLLAESGEIFERLKARPWFERVVRSSGRSQPAAV